ncbi:hypothetical protein K7X08_010038 [Anisodus acutangulus]|uniref:Uncharacterized protein n=1 Tax=Anisodus acutangulus TaxID=402998 RepID=A0A9Q1N0D3_9SOLA|nr:hypothetical protein K7X08_010038 [Anisodus acutangulus]
MLSHSSSYQQLKRDALLKRAQVSRISKKGEEAEEEDFMKEKIGVAIEEKTAAADEDVIGKRALKFYIRKEYEDTCSTSIKSKKEEVEEEALMKEFLLEEIAQPGKDIIKTEAHLELLNYHLALLKAKLGGLNN